jgi:hypothetical protein
VSALVSLAVAGLVSQKDNVRDGSIGESSYGAAASIVVVLIWVYYTAQIILLGAEFVRARALQTGRA